MAKRRSKNRFGVEQSRRTKARAGPLLLRPDLGLAGRGAVFACEVICEAPRPFRLFSVAHLSVGFPRRVCLILGGPQNGFGVPLGFTLTPASTKERPKGQGSFVLQEFLGNCATVAACLQLFWAGVPVPP